VRSFADSDGNGEGDIRGIIEKLDYIEALGAKVIWLTPINTSETYHGYDVTDYYGIAPQLGSALDFAELVYKAREKDIRIMMDLVVNHTSTQNAWFQNAVNLRKGVNLRGEEIDYRNFYHFQYHPTHTDELGPACHRFST
jgi:glycosidase